VELPKKDPVHHFEVPLDPKIILGQDLVAWEAQGEIVDRSQERLGWSDEGLILFRQLLKEQAKIAQGGGDPMNVFRDKGKNLCIDLPIEDYGSIASYPCGSVRHGNTGAYSPVTEELDALLVKAAKAAGAFQARQAMGD
jgi:5,5'-dehydrodivanillate O-demethylase